MSLNRTWWVVHPWSTLGDWSTQVTCVLQIWFCRSWSTDAGYLDGKFILFYRSSVWLMFGYRSRFRLTLRAFQQNHSVGIEEEGFTAWYPSLSLIFHTCFLIMSFWPQREQIHTIKEALQLISTPPSHQDHTGIQIIQQIATMMGCAVLPHLQNLVNCIAHGLW